MATVGKLKAILGLNDTKFRKGLKRAQKRTRVFGKTAKKVGGMIAGALSFTAVIAGTKRMISTFASFSQMASKLEAITGKTSKELEGLTNQAKLLGRTTQKSASQVAGLQVELAKKGFRTDQISAATEGIVNLSIAAGEDLPKAAEIGAGVMNAFGMEAEQMGRISDVMAESFSSTALDLNKFQYGMSKVAPVAKQVNMSLERTTAMLGTLIDSNVDASTASAQLRNILITVKKEGISLSQAFGRIRKAQEPVNVATELFGKRAAPIASILANNTDKADRLTKAFENAEGSAKKMADTMQDNLQGDMDAAKSAIEGMFIAIGESQKGGLRGAVQGFTESIRNATENVGQWISKALKWIKIIGKVAAGFVAAKVAIGAYLTIAKAARIAMIAYQGAAKVARYAQIALNTAMKANPIGLVVSLIGALVGAFVTAWKSSEKFRNFFKKLWIRIKQYSKSAWDAVDTYFGSIGTILKTIGKAITQVFQGKFKDAKNTIVNGFKGIVGEFGNIGKDAKKQAEKELAELEDSGKDIGKDVDASFAEGLIKDAKTEKAAEKKGEDTAKAFQKGVSIGMGKTTAPEKIESKSTKPVRSEEGEETEKPFSDEQTEKQIANMNAVIQKTKEQQKAYKQTNQTGNLMGSVMTKMFEGMSNSLQKALDDGENILQSFWKFFIDMIKGLIIKLATTLAVAIALSAVLGGVFGVGGGFGGAMDMISGGGGLGGIAKGAIGMKEGGVVPGGYPNDSYPAMLSSGEQVYPPDRLPSKDSGTVKITGEFKQRGSDLVASINEQRKKENRAT